MYKFYKTSNFDLCVYIVKLEMLILSYNFETINDTNPLFKGPTFEKSIKNIGFAYKSTNFLYLDNSLNMSNKFLCENSILYCINKASAKKGRGKTKTTRSSAFNCSISTHISRKIKCEQLCARLYKFTLCRTS